MKKALVLVMVSGIMLVISILAVAALNLMTVESRTAEHKLRRIRGYFAAQGAAVHALERLRRDGTAAGTITDINDDDPNIGGIATNITVAARGGAGCPAASPSPFCVNATATY